MQLNKIFGKRIIKTALATGIAVGLGEFFQINTPVMAGISAIVSMTSSVVETYNTSFNRMIATILGGLIACFFHLFGLQGIIPITIGIILVINTCIYFKWKKTITLSCIVFLIIMLYHPTSDIQYYEYAFYRIIDTFIGLFLGFIINYFIFPPKRSEFLLEYYEENYEILKSFFYKLLTGVHIKQLDDLITGINEIHTEIDVIRKEHRFHIGTNAPINDIIHINLIFYTIFGILIEMFDDNKIPQITEENKKRIDLFFNQEVPIDQIPCDNEYQLNFNYRIEKVIRLFEKAKINVQFYRKEIGHGN